MRCGRSRQFFTPDIEQSWVSLYSAHRRGPVDSHALKYYHFAKTFSGYDNSQSLNMKSIADPDVNSPADLLQKIEELRLYGDVFMYRGHKDLEQPLRPTIGRAHPLRSRHWGSWYMFEEQLLEDFKKYSRPLLTPSEEPSVGLDMRHSLDFGDSEIDHANGSAVGFAMLDPPYW